MPFFSSYYSKDAGASEPTYYVLHDAPMFRIDGANPYSYNTDITRPTPTNVKVFLKCIESFDEFVEGEFIGLGVDTGTSDDFGLQVSWTNRIVYVRTGTNGFRIRNKSGGLVISLFPGSTYFGKFNVSIVIELP